MLNMAKVKKKKNDMEEYYCAKYTLGFVQVA